MSNLQRNPKRTPLEQPYASLTNPQDSTHFSGIFLSKEKREETGKTVAQVQNTAEAGAKVGATATAVAVGVPTAAALAPFVATLAVLDNICGYSEEAREVDRANGYADWR